MEGDVEDSLILNYDERVP